MLPDQHPCNMRICTFPLVFFFYCSCPFAYTIMADYNLVCIHNTCHRIYSKAARHFILLGRLNLFYCDNGFYLWDGGPIWFGNYYYDVEQLYYAPACRAWCDSVWRVAFNICLKIYDFNIISKMQFVCSMQPERRVLWTLTYIVCAIVSIDCRTVVVRVCARFYAFLFAYRNGRWFSHPHTRDEYPAKVCRK